MTELAGVFEAIISIHAPREGSDVIEDVTDVLGLEFQSTLPVRGATSNAGLRERETENFNPRSP